MTDDKKKGDKAGRRWSDEDGNWSTEAKVGAAAAVGSAALVAALLFVGKRKKDRKLEPQSPDVPPTPPAPTQTGDSE
jgi:hypothetical protein